MQGDWAAESMVQDGQRYPDEDAQARFRTVKGDTYSVFRFSKLLGKGSMTGETLDKAGQSAHNLADMLNIEVERPRFIETTALGAAMLAAVGAGIYRTLEDAAVMRGAVERFAPAMAARVRETRLAGWADALGRVLG